MTEMAILLALIGWSSLAIAAAWLAPARLQTATIAACGMGLMASTASWISLAILVPATLLSHACYRGAIRNPRLPLLGIAGVAVLLVAALTLSAHSSTGGIEGRVLLPLGLAFYALRLIHYLFESYKGTLRPHGLVDVLCYQFLPSTLPAGPIHRFDEFLRDLRRRRWDSAQFSAGAERVLYGMVKLTFIGNRLIGEALTDALAPITAGSGPEAVYLNSVLFWLKLYVLFSGYSDVAIGFAAMGGFRIRENFRWPMLARNIADFWQRWHLSLSSWCRDYVFTPVQSATRQQGLAVVSSMIVLGLWHELSFRYVLWGAYHGAGIAVFRRFDARFGASIDALPAPLAQVWRVLATLLTLNFVLLSFTVTHAIQSFLTSL